MNVTAAAAWIISALIVAAGTPAHALETARQLLHAEAHAAWDGVVRPGSWTEIAVRLVAERGGEVVVEVGGADTGSTMVSGLIEPGVAALWRIPARTGAADALAVSVRGPDGAQRRLDVPLRRLAPDERVVAGPAGIADRAELEHWPGVLPLELDARSVPTWAVAFATLDALIVTSALLTRLDGAQLRVLERYLEDCGRVLAIGLSDAAAARARQHAGCGGEGVRTVAADAPWRDSLAPLLHTRAATLPGPAELGTLLADGRATVSRSLAAFFISYAVALVLGALALRRPWSVALIPVAASLVLLVGAHLSRPEIALATWTAGNSAARTARFVALLRVTGMAPGRFDVELPPLVDVPDAVVAGAATVRVAPDRPSVRLEIDTTLWSERLVYLRGPLAWDPGLSVEDGATGPRVENGGSTRSRPAYLRWRDDVFAVPALEAGAGWTPVGADPTASALPRMWAPERAAGADDSSLLIPDDAAALWRLATTAPPIGWTTIAARAPR